MRWIESGFRFAVLAICTTTASAAVDDVAIVDITPTAFSVVWFSDEAINSNSVRVFNDQDGLDEITTGLTVTSDSAAVSNAHNIGISKVTVSGLAEGQTVYVQTVTDSASGIVQQPAVGALIAVTAQNAANQITTNEIIEMQVNDPANETDPLDGALAFAEIVDTGAVLTTRVAGLSGESGTPSVQLNLNNLFDLSTTQTTEITGDSIVRVTRYRGQACADVENQRQISYGRIPINEVSPKPLVDCFVADRLCDNVINALDVQFVVNAFRESLGTCAFSPYLDVVPDGVINILDVQLLLNRFGETAPFTP